VPEVAIASFVGGVALLSYFGQLPPRVLRWLAPTIHEAPPGWAGHSMSWWWYVIVGQSLFLFVLLRWLLRWSVWGFVLTRVTRHRPIVQPAHADRVGGLGFLAIPLFAFRFFSIGVGAALASVWYDEIARGRAQPANFAADLLVFLCGGFFIGFAPYVFPMPLLVRKRLEGERRYTALVRRYVASFEKRWMGHPHPPNKELLGTGDIQSLADIGNSFAVVAGMRSTIPSLREVQVHLAVGLAPFLVVFLLQAVSAVELIQRILGRFLGG
jgi:hypothetical protein